MGSAQLLSIFVNIVIVLVEDPPKKMSSIVIFWLKDLPPFGWWCNICTAPLMKQGTLFVKKSCNLLKIVLVRLSASVERFFFAMIPHSYGPKTGNAWTWKCRFSRGPKLILKVFFLLSPIHLKQLKQLKLPLLYFLSFPLYDVVVWQLVGQPAGLWSLISKV